MASRTTASASNPIDPVQIAAFALKRCKTKADYSRIAAANTEEDLNSAWNTLSPEDQARIHQIFGATPQPDLQAIADELLSCGNLIQLQAMKAEHGPDIVKQAWKLIPAEERMRLTRICQTEQPQLVEETPQPVTEQPAICQVEPQAQPIEPDPQPKNRSRTLFTMGDDLERLNELLDDCGDDAQQQELISQ